MMKRAALTSRLKPGSKITIRLQFSAIALMLALAGATSTTAQPLSFGQIDGPPVVTLNQDRLFTESDFGQRAQDELEQASATLARDNREIEAALLQEELDLTRRRAEMEEADFRPLADEFDQRVEGIRASQAERLRNLNAQADAVRRFFIQATTPVLLDLLQERGAVAVLDARAVIYSVEGVDITDLALTRINRDIGDGGEGAILDRLQATDP